VRRADAGALGQRRDAGDAQGLERHP
jgi:hypothetical protein